MTTSTHVPFCFILFSHYYVSMSRSRAFSAPKVPISLSLVVISETQTELFL